MKDLIEKLKSAKRIAAFTGAGVSTLCGIPDFRGPQGLYKHADAERIFDINWFERDPSIYNNGCKELIYGQGKYQPGPVHKALVTLEKKLGTFGGVITQNIDMLHQKAGSSVVYEVHGSPIRHHCTGCGRVKTYDEILEMLKKEEVAHCEYCGAPFKPDVTFFGEALPEEAFRNAIDLACGADLMLVLGTSLTVHPAAGIPRLTLQGGGEVVLVNGQPTSLDDEACIRMDDLAEFAKIIEEAFA